MINTKLSQFGTIDPPPGVTNFKGGSVQGIPVLLNITIKSLITVAMVYAVFNLVLAGYWYLTAAGDSKRIGEASAKIWQTIIGMIVAGGSIMLAGLIGEIFFGNSSAILNLTVFTPN